MKSPATIATNATKIAQSEPPSNPYELLDELGKKIVDLKLEGWKYQRLVPLVKLNEQSIRRWFMKGGQYYLAYRWRRNQLLKEALGDFAEAEFHLKQGVADAVVVLKGEIAQKNWKAAVSLLKMTGFDIQKLIVSEESKATQLVRKLIRSRRNVRHQAVSAVQTAG